MCPKALLYPSFLLAKKPVLLAGNCAPYKPSKSPRDSYSLDVGICTPHESPKPSRDLYSMDVGICAPQKPPNPQGSPTSWM
uniref:Uncharacterized protein n=1 Tax=Chelonoidis abingdonii TaxID=106734 RepID=A0A8C0G6E6_CHEAB